MFGSWKYILVNFITWTNYVYGKYVVFILKLYNLCLVIIFQLIF